MRSDLHASNWRGAITLFNGFTGTRPTHEETCTAPRLAELIAPIDGAQVVLQKAQGLYFVPCLLKEAPLVGKTGERAHERGMPLIGKMRSAAHVATGAYLKLDIDGMSQEAYDAMLEKLRDAGLAYLTYSTHSNGRADKPGVRARVILFLDRSLEPKDYQAAAMAASSWLLGTSLDPSEARLSQQGGVWMVHPDRTEAAFCFRQLNGYCISAVALLAAAPPASVTRSNNHQYIEGKHVGFDTSRVAAALEWLDSNDYSAWVNSALWCRAAFGDTAFSAWAAWSQTAAPNHRADEGRCIQVWSALTPIINADAGAGALFAAARDAAIKSVEAAADHGDWSGSGKRALVYLRRFHRNLYREMFEEGAAA
jgi:hypothetical protein